MKEVFQKIQQKFLEQVRNKLPNKFSFAEIVAEDLNISIDSAYRRIRGETILSFKEVRTLCVKYGVSLDSIIAGAHDSVVFNYRAINPDTFDFDKYLSSITANLATMNSFKVRELIYAAKDIPLFYLYMFDKLSAFKIFFWSKNIFQFPDFKRRKFSFEEIPGQTIALGKNIWKQYLTIPSIEIWSDESINVTLKQIKFYRECDIFESDEVMLELCEDILKLIDHLERMAELGYKFDPDNRMENPECYYKLYYNEILISDNTVFFQMDDIKVTHLGHNVLNILTSTDPLFCNNTHQTMMNVIKNSTLISVASEKVRSQFFNSMRKKVESLMNNEATLV